VYFLVAGAHSGLGVGHPLCAEGGPGRGVVGTRDRAQPCGYRCSGGNERHHQHDAHRPSGGPAQCCMRHRRRRLFVGWYGGNLGGIRPGRESAGRCIRHRAIVSLIHSRERGGYGRCDPPARPIRSSRGNNRRGVPRCFCLLRSPSYFSAVSCFLSALFRAFSCSGFSVPDFLASSARALLVGQLRRGWLLRSGSVAS
jgi:hypothetical protein